MGLLELLKALFGKGYLNKIIGAGGKAGGKADGKAGCNGNLELANTP